MYKVSSQWKDPDFIFKNPDFLLKNVDFVTKQAVATINGWRDESTPIAPGRAASSGSAKCGMLLAQEFGDERVAGAICI